MERASLELISACEKGEAGEIAELSMACHESKGKIDALFDELSALTAEHDSKVRE